MPYDPDEIAAVIASPLGWFLLGCAAMNLAAAWRWSLGPGDGRRDERRDERRARWSWAGVWLAVAIAFAVLGGLALAGRPVGLPEPAKRAIDAAATPPVVSAIAYAALFVAFAWRPFFVRPAVAWSILNAALLWLGLSLPDGDFAAAVAAPDNLPIVGMVFLLGFFVWLGTKQAVENDRRMAGELAGESASKDGRTAEPLPPVEAKYREKVLAWPDLVYIELIAALLLTTLLIVWSLMVPAPLEPPANPAVTPNPSKAPWYFLGLQELLGFADAWWVGVVVPLLILLGLSAIPYLDRRPQGSGYYSIRHRRFAWLVFLGGFLLLWILPILVGTFMRGPNWSAFGPYERRDPQKLTAEQNIRLSDAFWAHLLERDVPQPAAGAGTVRRFAAIAWRELPGLALMAVYLVGLPLLLARFGLKWARQQLGRGRYWLMTLLLLLMLTLPAKMFLRWTCGLSYIVSMPEYGMNF